MTSQWRQRVSILIIWSNLQIVTSKFKFSTKVCQGSLTFLSSLHLVGKSNAPPASQPQTSWVACCCWHAITSVRDPPNMISRKKVVPLDGFNFFKSLFSYFKLHSHQCVPPTPFHLFAHFHLPLIQQLTYDYLLLCNCLSLYLSLPLLLLCMHAQTHKTEEQFQVRRSRQSTQYSYSS